MTLLKIQYSKEYEVTRIKNTLSRMDWYNKHNYKPLLPKGVTPENAKEIVKKEFNKKEYEKAKKELLDKINPEVLKEIELTVGKKIPDEIIVILTKYGVGGSYNLPNIVIINFKARARHDTLYCLKHEIIHLLVEEEVQKKKLTQEQKEELVNGLMEKVEGELK